MKVGTVIRIFAQDTNPPKVKLFIVVGADSENLATIYINTNVRLQDFPEKIQSSQLPISPDKCPFLDHNSFIDCSDLREKKKNDINHLLQKEPGRKEGEISKDIMAKIFDILKKSKSISHAMKLKYGLVY